MTSELSNAVIRVAVVCVSSSAQRVRRAISQNVLSSQAGKIPIVVIPDHWKRVVPYLVKHYNESIPSAQFVQVIVLDDIKLRQESVDDQRRLLELPSLIAFERQLPVILKGVGLDWLTSASDALSHWRHGVINREHIEKWINQFDRLGSNGWIGEGLIKGFEFWTDNKLIESIDFTKDAIDGYSRICLHKEQTGKSADVLANLISKKIKPFKKDAIIEDFGKSLSSIQSPVDGHNILFLEDGLFSGTEIVGLFEDLLGVDQPVGRTRKVQPLSDISILKNMPITLLFPVATSFGVARLRNFLTEKQLSVIELAYCGSGYQEVLTEEGSLALEQKVFFDPQIRNCPANPDAHFVRKVLKDISVWKKDDRIERAISFCQEVGHSLFSDYLARANYEWHPTKIRRCSLGMYGMGLAFGFAHSIPKASLPLFWAKGKATFEGKSIEWTPLFPNAE